MGAIVFSKEVLQNIGQYLRHYNGNYACMVMYGTDGWVKQIEDVTDGTSEKRPSYDVNRLVRVVKNPKFLGMVFMSPSGKANQLTEQECDIMEACSLMKKSNTHHVKIAIPANGPDSQLNPIEELVCVWQNNSKYRCDKSFATAGTPITSLDLDKLIQGYGNNILER